MLKLSNKNKAAYIDKQSEGVSLPTISANLPKHVKISNDEVTLALQRMKKERYFQYAASCWRPRWTTSSFTASTSTRS